ncbi:MAG: Methyltransferase type 11 [Moraxellaceae bacterium]|jgi:SAM-dependent methyltransferase|nr:Methyltransferase type 11 [Moraxellaceae bacterium]
MNDDGYARLFNVRGRQYDSAMTRYPQARDAEFLTAMEIAGVQPGVALADIPCGGGYLARYLPADVTLYSVDSSDVFADCARRGGTHRFLLAPIDEVPLAEGQLDHVISLAGLHHIADRRPFWRECARLLRPGGVLTAGDVHDGSAVARFLDGVVDHYTSTGHHGIYFDERTVSELEGCGFAVESMQRRRIGWKAADRHALADFCCLLFGLEGIDAAGLEPLLAQEIGFRDTTDGVELDWELVFFRAVRR